MDKILSAYLSPPGCGVYTVNTAKEKKEQLHQVLFNTIEQEAVQQKFQAQLNELTHIPSDKVALLGICSDNGGGIQRGANWGPLFIRETLYQTSFKDTLIDLGDTKVIPHLLHDKYINEKTIASCQKALYGQISELAVSPLSVAEEALNHLHQNIDSLKLLALGGDHSVSYPLMKAFLNAKKGTKIGLIHFDAHTDLLKERLGIDLCFGSWLTHVLPYFDEPSHVIQLGIRSSGKPKAHWESEFGIKQYWAQEIEEISMRKVVEACITHFKQKGIEEIYISFDIDGLDAKFASATGTPEPEGLSLDDACFAIASLTEAFNLTGADLVEVAPFVNANTNVDEPKNTLHSAQKICEHLIEGMLK